jgi:hypothetical protein
MSLDFYDVALTQVVDGENLYTTEHHGVLGESMEKLAYIRNDDPGSYYVSVQVWAQDTGSPDSTLGVYGNGWGVKLSEGARQPTPDEWEEVIAGDAITLSDIGTSALADTSNYHPFWMKVTTPGNLPAQSKTSIKLYYRGISYVVGS